jgi:membrane protein required for colicin V production
VTLFDYSAGLLLLVSGLIGLARGATREITTVVALVLAAVAAVFALRFTGPVARHAIHAAWLANIVALLVIFVLSYLVFRLIGGMLTRGVQEAGLSSLDRILGLGVGLVRALVVLGGVTLLLGAASPPERMPRWISQAKLFPLALAAGGALRAFAPHGMKLAREVAPTLEGAVAGDAPSNAETSLPGHQDPYGHDGPTRRHRASDSLEEDSR